MKSRKVGTAAVCILFSLLAACARPVSYESIQVESIPYESIPVENSAAGAEAFAAVLEGIYNEHILPDGGKVVPDDYSDISENMFAVYDVDLDGKQELIVLYTTASMAGMRGFVYAYDGDSGAVREELQEFPALTFYDNGSVKADWSHNQGLAGDFWPYTVYSYKPETDSYGQAGMADAWDRALSETDFDGNPFPDDIDADGDGILYYIMTGGGFERNTPVDMDEYVKWRDSWMGSAQQLEIPFMNLTEENIQSIR